MVVTQYFLFFTPSLGDDEPILTCAYFSNGLMINHQPDVHDGLGRNVLNLMNLQVETPEEFGFKKAEVFTAKNSITEQAASWKDRPFILGSDIFQFFQGALFARFFGGGGHFFQHFPMVFHALLGIRPTFLLDRPLTYCLYLFFPQTTRTQMFMFFSL